MSNKNKKTLEQEAQEFVSKKDTTQIKVETDDFFAAAHRILNIETPVFKDALFDKHGKWMDGWETRRRRSKGFDYLILKFEFEIFCKT